VAMGKVQVNGTVLCPELENINLSGENKIIAPSFVSIPMESYLIPLEELFNSAGVTSLDYKMSKLKVS